MLSHLRTGLSSMLIFTALGSSSEHLSAGPHGDEMTNKSVALFASADRKTTLVGAVACVPLAPMETVDRLDLKRDGALVFQHVRAVGDAGGPYAVYMVPTGVDRPPEQNRIAYFSLYSVQQRTDSQELSFAVKSSLLRKLLRSQPAAAHIQVCVKDTNPSQAARHSPSITFDKIVLVQIQRD
jgi:hypothetical protein